MISLKVKKDHTGCFAENSLGSGRKQGQKEGCSEPDICLTSGGVIQGSEGLPQMEATGFS